MWKMTAERARRAPPPIHLFILDLPQRYRRPSEFPYQWNVRCVASWGSNNQKNELKTSSIRKAFMRAHFSLSRSEAWCSTGLIWQNKAARSLMWLLHNGKGLNGNSERGAQKMIQLALIDSQINDFTSVKAWHIVLGLTRACRSFPQSKPQLLKRHKNRLWAELLFCWTTLSSRFEIFWQTVSKAQITSPQSHSLCKSTKSMLRWKKCRQSKHLSCQKCGWKVICEVSFM